MDPYVVASGIDQVGIESGGASAGSGSGGDSAGPGSGGSSADSGSGGASAGSGSGGSSAGYGSGGASAGPGSGGSSAGYGSGGASAGSESLTASAGPAPAVDVVAAGELYGQSISIWSKMPAPGLGLAFGETVLSGGALARPVLRNGSEIEGMMEDQNVLRGGHLKKPYLFSGLAVVDGMQFITLDKSLEGLCLYLTGLNPWRYPLKHVHVFEDMQKKMIKQCNVLIAKTKDVIARSSVVEPTAATKEMNLLVKETVLPKKRGHILQHRIHKKRVLNALPTTGEVDMSMGETSWHPVCLIRPGQQNVAVQVTTDNFMKLFDIVNRCVHAHAAAAKEGVQTPTRKLRRTRSNPLKPKGPPEERKYYTPSKGWIVCSYPEDAVTPPNRRRESPQNGGVPHTNRSANRRFLKNSRVKPAGISSGPRPVAKKKASAGDTKRNRHGKGTQIKKHEAVAPESDDDDSKSDTSEMFGGVSS